MNHFDKAFEELIGFEGGYSNDPFDAGGETNWGISKRQYPDLDIKNLTIEDAKAIYFRDYWQGIGLDQIVNPNLATELFEQGVNFGRYWAAYHLQRALNLLGKDLLLDGVIGPVTRKAANSYGDQAVLLKVLNGLQLMRYVEITSDNPTQKRFFVGWLKRVA